MNEVIILCLWINNRIFAAIFLNDILMNYGYVKVAAAVPRVKVADCKFNAGATLPGTTKTRLISCMIGGLAQLARASALHAEGQRFESVILHH